MQIRFKIGLYDFTIAQFAIVTLIIVLGLSSYIFSYIAGYDARKIWFLDVGHEQSIPTYFSTLNLLLSAILILIIYSYERINNNKGYRYWLFLSILFLFLSIDESISIHERFGKVYHFLSHSGLISPFFETHGWLPFGMLFVLIIGVGLFPFFKLLPRITLYYFLISGLIFIIGAIGFEFIGLIMLKTGFVESSKDILYSIRRIFEEGFEMYGVALFNCALYREITNRKISLIICR